MSPRWPSRRGADQPPRVYLHIGGPSTGTTYLQRLMLANRDALDKAGYLLPADWGQTVAAVRDVMHPTAVDPRMRAETEGQWDVVRDRMLSHSGRASVLSMEFLCFCDEETARRIVDSLAGAEVHVVLTVRDTAAVLRSQWQTSIRNGSRLNLPRLLWGMRATLNADEVPDVRPVRMIERALGVPRMLDTWIPLVGAEQVHVVTVPRSSTDPDLLWKRFAEVIGVNPKVCQKKSVHANPSLGLASTELLRMVNTALGEVHRIEYRRVVKSTLARDILGVHADQERRVELHRPGRNLTARWNARVAEAIRTRGVPVVGDLGDLPTTQAPKDVPTTLARSTDDELLEAAAWADERMRAYVSTLEARLAAVHADPAAAGAAAPGDGGYDDHDDEDDEDGRDAYERGGEDGDDDGESGGLLQNRSEAVRAAVLGLTEVVRTAVDLDHQIALARSGPSGPGPVRK